MDRAKTASNWQGHSVIPCCEGQLFKVTRVQRFFGSQEAKGTRILDVKHDVCIVWIVLENFDFTHIRLIRLWILHDFTMSCQVHQRLWIPGKVPPRWGFYGPPWDARRCRMEKTCDDNRWCQMAQCWWRSFQILLKNSTIFGMLSIWECEKSEPSLNHVRFLVGDCPNGPALPWLEFCWDCDCNLLQHCSCWSGSIRRARHAGRLAWA